MLDSKTDMLDFWYDYSKGDYITLPSNAPLTDDLARRFIPQHPAHQGLYGVIRQMGKSELEALAEVLEAMDKAHTKAGQP